MRYQKLEQLLSPPRIGRYKQACNGSATKAAKLYHANLRVAQAFYPVLSLFEVILRSAIDQQLTRHFNDPAWIIHQTSPTGFMSDAVLGRHVIPYYLKKQVNRAKNNLRNRGTTITPSRIVAEQTFGFWKSLFQTNHYRLTQGTLIHCFPQKPTTIQRADLHQRIKLVNQFRNRVYHNEPLCFDPQYYSRISFQQAIDARVALYDLLEWMDAAAKIYVLQYDNIPNKIRVGRGT